jgi:predicted site-specific integrase-resolvase
LPVHLGHSAGGGECQGAQAIARAIGVSRMTILRWKRAGAPIYLVGRKYQCRYDDLWQWIGANEKSLYKSVK